MKDDAVIQIEGHPDSPISRGRLCPKGAASRALVTSPTRLTKVREMFFQGDQSLGKRTIRLTRQSDDPRYAKFRENVRWTQGGVLFVTLPVRDPQRSKPGNQMPPNPMPQADIDALLAYLETLR